MMRICFLIFLVCILCGRAGAQVTGCTDPLANNYNPAATINDGSCTYNSASVGPASSVNLPATVMETSGLAYWNGSLWTHNDNTDLNLYALDTSSGVVIQTKILNNVLNNDWEEISQDSNYIYIGDFGNNANGNRTDLHILRIEKNSLIQNNPLIDTLWFTYSDQTDFTPAGANNTDYDCEAFIVSADSIYLFTKQWVAKKTKVYAMPRTPGSHAAAMRSILDVQGLITGATYLEDRRLVVLCGYTNLLQPFLYLLYDFNDHDFFAGNKRKLTVSLPFHQTEGVATHDGKKYWLSNEQFVNPPLVNVPQKLHVFDLDAYLGVYLDNLSTGTGNIAGPGFPDLYPNPADDHIMVKIKSDLQNAPYCIYDSWGRRCLTGRLTGPEAEIRISKLRSGLYYFQIDGCKAQPFQIEGKQ